MQQSIDSWQSIDTELPKDETSETIVRNLMSPFSYVNASLHLLCKNLSNNANETYVDKLSLNKSLVKSNMIYANRAKNVWRIQLLKDLLLIRSNQNVLEGFL